jgi:ABC-type uncharacterized transport system substrate-binding protein
MRRREFITLLGGTAAVWPLATRAQQPTMPMIGFLSARSPSESASVVAASRNGLREASYVEGQNVHVEFRWAEGQYDKLPALAADLLRKQVAVIAALSSPAALAAKAATSTIAVVFHAGIDPVGAGLVASLNRPGGNVTGVTFFTAALEPKRLGLLRELIPQAHLVAVLVNPNYPDADVQLKDVQEATREIGQRALILTATIDAEIEPPSPRSRTNGLARSWSVPIRSSTSGVNASLRLRQDTMCRRFITGESMSRLEVF